MDRRYPLGWTLGCCGVGAAVGTLVVSVGDRLWNWPVPGGWSGLAQVGFFGAFAIWACLRLAARPIDGSRLRRFLLGLTLFLIGAVGVGSGCAGVLAGQARSAMYVDQMVWVWLVGTVVFAGRAIREARHYGHSQ